MSLIRLGAELAVLAALLGTVGCQSSAARDATAAAASSAGTRAAAPAGSEPRPPAPVDEYRVDVPGAALRVPAKDWTPMKNEYPWAENFEARRKDPRRGYQVVTVFKLPMSDDRRSGVRISPNEYLDAFVTNPGELTVLIRVDKGSYWVLSREMFAAPSVSWNTPDQVNVARSAFQAEIDTTRYLLQTFGAGE